MRYPGKEGGQSGEVGVAAGEDHAGPRAGDDGAGEEGRQGAGAAGLDDQLAPFDEQAHGGEDLVVGDGDDVVDESVDDRPGETAGLGELLAVGDRRTDGDAPAGCRRVWTG